MPAASRPTIRVDCSTLSHDSVTCGGSPEVSSTAFRAQPPDLPPLCLVDVGFAVLCQLAPHRRPHHPVLVHRLAPLIHASFRPRLVTTPLRFSSPSPPPGWAGDFHPQAVEHVRHTKWKPSAMRRASFLLATLFIPSCQHFVLATSESRGNSRSLRLRSSPYWSCRSYFLLRTAHRRATYCPRP
jgi:hypothetical protein